MTAYWYVLMRTVATSELMFNPTYHNETIAQCSAGIRLPVSPHMSHRHIAEGVAYLIGLSAYRVPHQWERNCRFRVIMRENVHSLEVINEIGGSLIKRLGKVNFYLGWVFCSALSSRCDMYVRLF